MTREEAIRCLEICKKYIDKIRASEGVEVSKELCMALDLAIKALEQAPIDKSAMMHEIYMEGVNMAGEYQGCWVRFKNIEKIVDKYMAESEGAE